MNIFINLLGFYLKTFARSFFYISTILFGFIILISRFIVRQLDEFEINNYGDFLGETVIITQGLSLCYMVYFYKLFSEELKYGVQSFFVDSYSILLKKIGSILSIHALIQLVTLLAQIMLLFLFYQVWSIPFSSFYKDSAIFIFCYMYMPIITSALLGFLVATIFGRSKVSIVIILFTWVLTGPLNVELFRDYFRSIPVGNIKSLWQLGVSNSERVFISYNGFELSQISIYKGIIFLLLNFCILLFVLLKWNKKSVVKLKVIGSGLIAVIFIVVMSQQVLKSKDNLLFSYADYNSERFFYKEQQDDQKPKIEYYQIDGYNIVLDFNEFYNARVDIEISNIKNRELVFTLYHGYEINYLKDNLNRNIDFQRKGDVITIQLVDVNIESITFSYAIKASPVILFEKHNKYLPAYLSWIPTQGERQLFYDDSLGNRLMTNVQSQSKNVNYTLKVQNVDRVPIATNLKKIADNIYEGYSDGVTLIMGDFLSYLFPGKDSEVIYPSDWRNMQEDWGAFQETAALILTEGNAILGDDLISTDFPKFIIFDSPNEVSFLGSNYLILSLDSLYSLSSPITLEYVPQELLKASTKHLNINVSEDAYNNWLNLCSLLIKLQLDLESGDAFFVKAYYPDGYNYATREDKESIEYVYKNFFELNLQKQRKFLKEWYEQLDRIDNDWQVVEKLMIEVGEGK